MSIPIRIAIIDDHAMFRAGVRASLPPRFDVVAEAGDVDNAITVLHDTTPDVVLLDVHLPVAQAVAGLKSSPAATPSTGTQNFLHSLSLTQQKMWSQSFGPALAGT